MFRIFFAILFIPAVAAIVISASSANLENRTAAAFPAVPRTFEEVENYFPSVDTYVRDQLGFRSQAIKAFQSISNFVNNNNSSLVVAGKDNWLYYTGGDTISRATGMNYSDARVQIMIDRTNEAYQLSKEVGADFVALPIPSKDEIYQEYLPDWAQKLAEKNMPTEHEKIVEGLKQNNIPYIDVDQILGQTKTVETPVYYTSDTHWNDYGAYVIFYEAVSRANPSSKLPTPEEYLERFESGKFYGVLDQFLGLNDTTPQLLPVFNEELLARSSEANATQEADHASMPSYEIDYGKESPRVLIIGDSFTYSFFRKYMGSYAGKYYWTHNHYGDYVKSKITSIKPDLVIFEFVDFEVPNWH